MSDPLVRVGGGGVDLVPILNVPNQSRGDYRLQKIIDVIGMARRGYDRRKEQKREAAKERFKNLMDMLPHMEAGQIRSVLPMAQRIMADAGLAPEEAQFFIDAYLYPASKKETAARETLGAQQESDAIYNRVNEAVSKAMGRGASRDEAMRAAYEGLPPREAGIYRSRATEGGLPKESFDAPEEEPVAADRAYTGNAGNLAGMHEEGLLSDDDYEKAVRVAAGLEPRAVSTRSRGAAAAAEGGAPRLPPAERAKQVRYARNDMKEQAEEQWDQQREMFGDDSPQLKDAGLKWRAMPEARKIEWILSGRPVPEPEMVPLRIWQKAAETLVDGGGDGYDAGAGMAPQQAEGPAGPSQAQGAGDDASVEQELESMMPKELSGVATREYRKLRNLGASPEEAKAAVLRAAGQG